MSYSSFGISIEPNVFINNIDGDEMWNRPKPRALQIKDNLREMGNYDRLSKYDKKAYDYLVSELEEIQKQCFHSWEYVELFTFIHAICEYCDFEETSYKHALHGRRLPAGRR